MKNFDPFDPQKAMREPAAMRERINDLVETVEEDTSDTDAVVLRLVRLVDDLLKVVLPVDKDDTK